MGVQVITFGHLLSEGTKNYLTDTEGSFEVFNCFIHFEKFSEVFEAVESTVQQLLESGADLSGNTKTYIVPPGSSAAAMAVVAMWDALAGGHPKLLNLIRQDHQYVPSPEKPILDLHEFKQQIRSFRGRVMKEQRKLARA